MEPTPTKIERLEEERLVVEQTAEIIRQLVRSGDILIVSRDGSGQRVDYMPFRKMAEYSGKINVLEYQVERLTEIMVDLGSIFSGVRRAVEKGRPEALLARIAKIVDRTSEDVSNVLDPVFLDEAKPVDE